MIIFAISFESQLKGVTYRQFPQYSENKKRNWNSRISWWQYNLSLINPFSVNLTCSGLCENLTCLNWFHIIHILLYCAYNAFLFRGAFFKEWSKWSLVSSIRSSDHCFAIFLRVLDDSRKLSNLIKPNLFVLTDSS